MCDEAHYAMVSDSAIFGFSFKAVIIGSLKFLGHILVSYMLQIHCVKSLRPSSLKSIEHCYAGVHMNSYKTDALWHFQSYG